MTDQEKTPALAVSVGLDQLQRECIEAEQSGDPQRIHAAYTRLGKQRAGLARARNDWHEIDPATSVLTGDRQTGKTHALVEWVKAGRTAEGSPTRVVIVTSYAMGDELRSRGLLAAEVLSWRSAVAGSRLAVRDSEWAVDETAEVLTAFLGFSRPPTVIAVMTGDRP